MKMYRVQQGEEGGQNRAFFAYVIYGWPLTDILPVDIMAFVQISC